MAQQHSAYQLPALGFRASLLDRPYGHPLAHIRKPLQLEGVARAFGISPSRLKRRLHKHDSHVREQLDLACKHMAL